MSDTCAECLKLGDGRPGWKCLGCLATAAKEREQAPLREEIASLAQQLAAAREETAACLRVSMAFELEAKKFRRQLAAIEAPVRDVVGEYMSSAGPERPASFWAALDRLAAIAERVRGGQG